MSELEYALADVRFWRKTVEALEDCGDDLMERNARFLLAEAEDNLDKAAEAEGYEVLSPPACPRHQHPVKGCLFI